MANIENPAATPTALTAPYLLGIAAITLALGLIFWLLLGQRHQAPPVA